MWVIATICILFDRFTRFIASQINVFDRKKKKNERNRERKKVKVDKATQYMRQNIYGFLKTKYVRKDSRCTFLAELTQRFFRFECTTSGHLCGTLQLDFNLIKFTKLCFYIMRKDFTPNLGSISRLHRRSFTRKSFFFELM